MNHPDPMVVSDPLAAFSKEGMLKIIAPAKVNLFLGVGALRSDGFHEVTNIMHAVTLHDVIHVDHEKESEGGLALVAKCYAREGLPPLELDAEDNLAVRAIRMLAAKIGRVEDETITLRIEKHIPHQAGLGGGSSDAAAALVGACRLWNIDPYSSEVQEVAAELGSDIAFFLYGGCACFTGKGERFTHELEPMKKPLVLIKPEKGASTADVYRTFDASPTPLPQELVEQAATAQRATDVPLFNNLTEPASELIPELVEIHVWAQEQSGVEGVLLSGSGSATTVVCDTFDSACALSAKARKQGWWSRVTNFGTLGASIIPPKR